MTNPDNSEPNLEVDLNGLTLKNPVIAASGTFGYGLEFTPFLDLNRLGGFSTKGLSLQPKMGNPVPRMIETASGMLNAIGLENIGLDKFIEEKLPKLNDFNTRLIVNFFGNTIEEYVEMAEALSKLERVDVLEMNISCPNVKEGGVSFSSNPEIVHRVVSAVRGATMKFLIVKLSPNVTDITEIAKSAEDAGADALSLINTQIGMTMNLKTRKPFLANTTGGLSGPAIKPIALGMVYNTAKVVKIPIIGLGGITTAEDALEFLMAGASAIQVGTANFIDPTATIKIIEGLTDWCLENGIKSLSELKPD
jgi:dihydroorotate dehydrogenase (NAD+) catalytic subunit